MIKLSLKTCLKVLGPKKFLYISSNAYTNALNSTMLPKIHSTNKYIFNHIFSDLF